MKIAVITGASSGLGREFARQLCREKNPPEELWLVARREDRLKALAKELPLPAKVVPLDLTDSADLDQLAALLQQEQPDVRVLINAAGFGKVGSYREVTRRDSGDMIELNCRAAVEVTLLALPHMRAGGRILQISSTSAFQPFPYLSVYAATKAFLLRYSRALRWELRERKISVTAVCPYWVKDTEFIPIARDTPGEGDIRSYPLASRCAHVVHRALLDSRRNFAVSTPGPVCTLHRVISKFLPHSLLMAGWEGLRKL